jgi:hypothetical protein
MTNPFQASKQAVATLFHEANGSDCARGMAVTGAVLLTPVVAPVAFVLAMFIKKKDK